MVVVDSEDYFPLTLGDGSVAVGSVAVGSLAVGSLAVDTFSD